MKHRIFLILIFSIGGFIQAQTLSQAKLLYTKGIYQKALPVFKRELKKKPNDASLNLWYGTCLLETGKLQASLPYLQIAAAEKLPEADKYLAEYYLKSNAPDTALIYINRYLDNPRITEGKKESGQLLKTSIEAFIDQSQRVEDVCFIDSIVVPKSKLYSTIKLSTEAGRLMPVNKAFPEIPVSAGGAYFPERNDRAFFASPIAGNHLDIVARHRILNDWGENEPLPETINTEADECNPYFLSDGITLYFASNRKGSMGGYDLYVTRLNSSKNTYLLPSQLDKPFNSSANDYFLIIDEFAKRGYLATDRNQPKDYVAIYTFIPSRIKNMLQGKSTKELEDFAQIRSIKATQKGKNLDSLLQNSQAPILTTIRENEPDIIFVINDTLQYSKESDFQSEEARKEYISYRSTYQKYAKSQIQLEEKRAQYLQASPEVQKQLSAEILQLESDILKVKKELPAMEKRVRNLEITKISK